MGESQIRVMIVDDHVALSWAITFLFTHEADLQVVASAATLAEARRHLAGGLEMDVALVDLELPDGSGIDLIHELCAGNPGASAIVLSGTATDRSRALAIAAGASGVLDRSAGEAVALTASADRFLREERATRSALASLTPRERGILQAVAERLSDKTTADRLYLSDRTALRPCIHIRTAFYPSSCPPPSAPSCAHWRTSWCKRACSSDCYQNA